MDNERSESEGALFSPATKACDACRARKIKCDRKTPCSSCVASKIHCKTSTRKIERKKRILISASYENEVKGVNERLDSLEKTIQALASNSRPKSNTDDQPQHSNTVRSPKTLENDHHVPFEGASSFSSLSKQAKQAFDSDTSHKSRPTELLSTSVLGKRNYSSDETKATVEDLPKLPSMSLVLKTLKAAKTNPKRLFPGLSDMNLLSLTDKCQKVYFPTEECSTAFMVVVIAGLWEMFNNFGESDLTEHGIDALEMESAKSVCKLSLDEAATRTPLLLEHSYMQIQALLLLSLFLIQTSRLSLALPFISACTRLCQSAGYHCLASDSSNPEVRKKIVTFWVVFSLDCGLSLNFGRGPTMQSYDITTSRPTIAVAHGNHDLFFCSIGAELAFLQGDIYKQLYSGRAQSESTDITTPRARDLADRLNHIRQELLSFETDDDDFAKDMSDGYDLVMQSHLALIYRAIPSNRGTTPLHFSLECVSASREAMESYNAAWIKYQAKDQSAWKMLINWTYLYSPFTAFIVLFGTVITSQSEYDLKLMEASVETLKSAAKYSSGIAKLHDACETFFNLASSYMIHTNQSRVGQLHHQFDMTAFDSSYFHSEDWNVMLDDWDLGLGVETAREMSSFLTEGFSTLPNMS